MDKKRIYYIDEARGLAMLVIVSWHILGIHSSWTDGWVMPVFFFIMGMFYRQDASLKKIVFKKLNTLVVPMLFCSLPALAVSLWNHGGIATLKKIANPYECINPCSWFLVCMFFCYVVYWAINRMAKDKKQRFLFALVVSLIGFYSSQMHIFEHRIVLPFFISTALSVMIFIETGMLVKGKLLTSWGVRCLSSSACCLFL